MTFLRPIMALLMSLTIAGTSVTMALARGHTGPTSVIVICNGALAQKIVVDENGQPVKYAHFCPDCALSLFDMAMPERISFGAQAFTRILRSGGSGVHGIARAETIPSARGPPLHGLI